MQRAEHHCQRGGIIFIPSGRPFKLILNTIWMAHSVSVITKGVKPSDTMSMILAGTSRISPPAKRNRLFPEKKKHKIQTQEQSCESTVARPEPATESPIPKIKTGSSRIFMIAPSSTELMAIKECPCVRIKGFSPWDGITKTVPQA